MQFVSPAASTAARPGAWRYFAAGCLVTGFLLSLSQALVEAQEWTRFRGPNGSGQIEYDIPASWTDQHYRWKTELPGIGHSSPVLWGERIFVLSADPESAERFVLCLSAANGEILWKKSYSSTPHHLHTRSSYASGSPAVDQDKLYVTWGAPEAVTVIALTHDGQEVWTRDLGPFVSQHGYGISPMLYEDLVIISNSQQEEELKQGETPGQSTLLALDRSTGQTVWSLPRKCVRVCYSVPCVYRNPEGQDELICFNTGDGFYSVNPRTGKLNWSVPDVFSMRTVSSPIEAGGLLFGSTGSGGGGNYVVAIRPGQKPGEKPEVAYRIDRQAPYVPTPVAHGDLLFLFYDKGFVSCVNARTGSEYWKKRLNGNVAFSGSPVRVGEKLFCIDESGEVVVLAADKEFRELARNQLGEPSRATPAVANGRMYLRTNSHLICIGGKSL